MRLAWMSGMVLLSSMVNAIADDSQSKQLANECYQEWQSRGWVIGAEGAVAADQPTFRTGIELFCEVRSELYLADSSYSFYIQETMRELAPFIFKASKQQIRDYIIQVQASGKQFTRNPFLSE